MNTTSKTMNAPQQPLRMLILDAARKLFAEHGYAQVSMRKLATTIATRPLRFIIILRIRRNSSSA